MILITPAMTCRKGPSHQRSLERHTVSNVGYEGTGENEVAESIINCIKR